jgi:hypothetical protein
MDEIRASIGSDTTAESVFSAIKYDLQILDMINEICTKQLQRSADGKGQLGDHLDIMHPIHNDTGVLSGDLWQEINMESLERGNRGRFETQFASLSKSYHTPAGYYDLHAYLLR